MYHVPGGDRLIRTLEELSLNAWPALQSMLYDGWLLRFSGGYTRRSNSINPLYRSSLPVVEKIAFCQEAYRLHGLPVVFKLTSRSQPTGLDEVLAQQGFRREAPTSVQIMDLAAWKDEVPASIRLAAQGDADWRDAFSCMSGIAPDRRQLHERILAAIVPQTCYASIYIAGEIAACGLGVVQDAFIGLYDIVTDIRFRRRGFGLSMVRGLIGWGVAQGARQAYLQVMLDNAPAQRLYRRVGFQETYQYWYRVGS